MKLILAALLMVPLPLYEPPLVERMPTIAIGTRMRFDDWEIYVYGYEKGRYLYWLKIENETNFRLGDLPRERFEDDVRNLKTSPSLRDYRP